MDITVNVVVGLAVMVVVAGLQLRTRELTARRVRIAGLLVVAGVVVVASAAATTPLTPLGLTAVLAGLAAGTVLGVARARTMPVWSEGGRLWTRGTRSTAALWVAGFGVHLGLDLLVRLVSPAEEPVSGASVPLFVGLTLAAQALAQLRRSPVAA